MAAQKTSLRSYLSYATNINAFHAISPPRAATVDVGHAPPPPFSQPRVCTTITERSPASPVYVGQSWRQQAPRPLPPKRHSRHAQEDHACVSKTGEYNSPSFSEGTRGTRHLHRVSINKAGTCYGRFRYHFRYFTTVAHTRPTTHTHATVREKAEVEARLPSHSSPPFLSQGNFRVLPSSSG